MTIQESVFEVRYEDSVFVLNRTDWVCQYTFSYNGVSCTDFDLMMYDISGSDSSDFSFASTVDIIEDIVGHRHTPYFYGALMGKRLVFKLVFGLNESRIDQNEYLTRTEISEIAKWLTGHNGYRWLVFDKDGMEDFRFKCVITNLKLVCYGKIPWTFEAEVTCDGPFVYRAQQEHNYTIDGSAQIVYDNTSSYNGYTRPFIEFQLTNGSGFSISNATENGRTLSFSGLPGNVGRIYVDNNSMTISCDSGENIYNCCNYKWLRLKRGENILNVTGHGNLKITSYNLFNGGR